MQAVVKTPHIEISVRGSAISPKLIMIREFLRTSQSPIASINLGHWICF
jgi:hypothetical protein